MSENVIVAIITYVGGPALLVLLNRFFSGREKTLSKLKDIEQKQDYCAKEIAELKDDSTHALKMSYYAAHGTMQLGANGPVKDAVDAFDESKFNK